MITNTGCEFDIGSNKPNERKDIISNDYQML